MNEYVAGFYSDGGTSLLITGIVLVVLGLLEALLGYRIFRIQVAVIAFLAGCTIGFGVLYAAFGILWLSIVVGVVLGALFIWLSIKFFNVGVFLIGAFFGFALGIGIMQNVWIGALVAVVVGALAVMLTRPVVILSTAFGGASLFAGGISTIFWKSSQAEPVWLHWIIIVVVGICGAIVQFRTTKEYSINKPAAKKE